jgi:hypothetical protein
MEKYLFIALTALLLAGCHTPPTPPVAATEPPHEQTNARHPSNLYPTANNHDSYMWYGRGQASRNVRMGEGYIGSGTTTEGYYGGGKRGAHGGAGPPEMYGPRYYVPSYGYPGFY